MPICSFLAPRKALHIIAEDVVLTEFTRRFLQLIAKTKDAIFLFRQKRQFLGYFYSIHQNFRQM